MRLTKYLGRLGYGSRKQIEADIARKVFQHIDGSELDAKTMVPHDNILYDGEPLDPPPGMVVVLHKPIGFTCSRKDQGPLVYDLLPPRWLARKPALSSVGRLDSDTSGLLLFTDDGQLLHQLISPKSNTKKVYEVELSRPLRGDEAEKFKAGSIVLKNETKPLKSAEFRATGETSAVVTLTEGRYHQVRRMFAALGNHVETLHRSQFGGLCLEDLAAGNYRVLKSEEVSILRPKKPD